MEAAESPGVPGILSQASPFLPCVAFCQGVCYGNRNGVRAVTFYLLTLCCYFVCWFGSSSFIKVMKWAAYREQNPCLMSVHWFTEERGLF